MIIGVHNNRVGTNIFEEYVGTTCIFFCYIIECQVQNDRITLRFRQETKFAPTSSVGKHSVLFLTKTQEKKTITSV